MKDVSYLLIFSPLWEYKVLSGRKWRVLAVKLALIVCNDLEEFQRIGKLVI